jgi:hypothetical protein
LRLSLLPRKLKTALHFSKSQWRLLFTAHVTYLKVRTLLFLLPSGHFTHLFLYKYKQPLRLIRAPHSRKMLLSMLRLAGRYQWPQPTCLIHAISCHLYLSRYGCASRLRIGVKKHSQFIKAHAWCEDADLEHLTRGGDENYEILEFASPLNPGTKKP